MAGAQPSVARQACREGGGLRPKGRLSGVWKGCVFSEEEGQGACPASETKMSDRTEVTQGDSSLPSP